MPTPSLGGPASDDRRRFLRFLGAGTLAVGAAGTLAACDQSDPNIETPPDVVIPAPPDVAFDFSGDVGVLNYAYALEQLEGAFYSLVAANFLNLFPTDEQNLIQDLAAHEGIHRDFLKAAIGIAGGTPIPDLSLNTSAFSGIATREAILQTALVFEDLGVGAYNGAGRYIADDGYLTIAGKIVSVEARHAAAIATALTGSSDLGGTRLNGSDVIDPNGLDQALAPATVLAAAQPFVLNRLSAVNA